MRTHYLSQSTKTRAISEALIAKVNQEIYSEEWVLEITEPSLQDLWAEIQEELILFQGTEVCGNLVSLYTPLNEGGQFYGVELRIVSHTARRILACPKNTKSSGRGHYSPRKAIRNAGS